MVDKIGWAMSFIKNVMRHVLLFACLPNFLQAASQEKTFLKTLDTAHTVCHGACATIGACVWLSMGLLTKSASRGLAHAGMVGAALSKLVAVILCVVAKIHSRSKMSFQDRERYEQFMRKQISMFAIATLVHICSFLFFIKNGFIGDNVDVIMTFSKPIPVPAQF